MGYLQISVIPWDGGKGISHLYANDSEILPKAKPSEVFEYLNKLGKEGWEMISATPSRYTLKAHFGMEYLMNYHLQVNYYFKRPIEE